MIKINKMKGTYTLLIKVSENKKIPVGKLGKINFKKGFYVYVGSALNGLEKRVERHLRKEKKIYWHIDYLLGEAEIVKVIYAKTDARFECKIAKNLERNLDCIKKFGCSDCGCESHLFYGINLNDLNNHVSNAYAENGLTPEIYPGQDQI